MPSKLWHHHWHQHAVQMAHIYIYIHTHSHAEQNTPVTADMRLLLAPDSHNTIKRLDEFLITDENGEGGKNNTEKRKTPSFVLLDIFVLSSSLGVKHPNT